MIRSYVSRLSAARPTSWCRRGPPTSRQPGPDGILGTADDIHEHENTTTPFVDQNQTYYVASVAPGVPARLSSSIADRRIRSRPAS